MSPAMNTKNLTYEEYVKIVNFYKQNVLQVMSKEDFEDVELRGVLIEDLPSVGYLIEEYSSSKSNYKSVNQYFQEFEY